METVHLICLYQAKLIQLRYAHGCTGPIHNDGTGNFSLGSVLLRVSNALASVIEDFDGDGFGDIAAPTSNGDGYNYRLCDKYPGVVMYGNSDLDYTRDWQTQTDYMVDNMIGLQLIAIDVNNDGFKDLMLMGTGDGYGEGNVECLTIMLKTTYKFF